jgi:hypothetical protein
MASPSNPQFNPIAHHYLSRVFYREPYIPNDWLITSITMNGMDRLDPATTMVQMQTQFLTNPYLPPAKMPQDVHKPRKVEDIIIGPGAPIGSTAKFIKTPESLGTESVVCNIRSLSEGEVCIESQVNNKVAILRGRSSPMMNRCSIAELSAQTHTIMFMQMAERRYLEVGDIVLLYKAHHPTQPNKNAELVMALVVSLAWEGLTKEGLWIWNHTMVHTRNRLLEIWMRVSEPTVPRTYLKAWDSASTPLKIPKMPDGNIGSKYFNTLLHWAPVNVIIRSGGGSKAQEAPAAPMRAGGSGDQAPPPTPMRAEGSGAQAAPPALMWAEGSGAQALPPSGSGGPAGAQALPPSAPSTEGSRSSTFTFGAPPAAKTPRAQE